ncbi:ParB/RepB/Spo0J family partition protein [Nocardioides sp. GXZ039]|uniref:ParB/RepB/Spo0J family partition protein n=1 Tax=Nocardioides sp. GXZ039 TaxID=3136018 RepID=UPI0030F49C42
MAGQRKTGMGTNPFGTKKPGRANLGVVTALREAAAADEAATAMPVVDLAPNPENPESRSQADEGLVASVTKVGVLVPLIVQSRSVFLAALPQHADAVGDAPYVILAGHERRAACVEAGVDEVPVIVRDDLVADDVMVAENVHRVALTPLEEAAVYRRVMDRQELSQRALAGHLGVPQARISKRLALLKLSPLAQKRVASGEMGLETAQEVAARLPEGDEDVAAEFDRLLVERPNWGAEVIASEAVHQVEAARRLAELEKQAEDEGVVFVADPRNKFKGREGQHRLTTKREIEKARKNDHLVLGPTTGYGNTQDWCYYTLAAPKTSKPALSKWELEAREEERGRKEAMKARREALATIVTRKGALSPTALDELRIEATLAGKHLNADAKTVCMKLALAAGLGPAASDLSEKPTHYEWMEAVLKQCPRGGADRARIAALGVVAAVEECASWTHRRWGVLDLVYFEWLQGQGYVPTEWESARLRKVQDEVGDSAESTPEAEPQAAAAGEA